MTPDSTIVRDSRYKDRVKVFMDSRRGKMFGIAEVAALAGSCLILVLVLLSYIYFLVPARLRVSTANAERKQVQTNLQTLQGVVTSDRTTTDTVQKVSASLNKFETDYLMREDLGRIALYDELNQLIIKNGVRNTSGPTYTTLEPEGAKTTAGKNVATKWQSFYPGIAVLVTVEGSYENLRRFIRDVERSKQFVVINEVELQRARDNNAPISVEGAAAPSAEESPEAGSGSRGSLVSLQLSMATYFQRETAPATVPATAPANQD